VNAAEALTAARDRWPAVDVDGEVLLKAAAPPPDVLDVLSLHKPDSVAAYARTIQFAVELVSWADAGNLVRELNYSVPNWRRAPQLPRCPIQIARPAIAYFNCPVGNWIMIAPLSEPAPRISPNVAD
jgi:hypothetical protein